MQAEALQRQTAGLERLPQHRGQLVDRCRQAGCGAVPARAAPGRAGRDSTAGQRQSGQTAQAATAVEKSGGSVIVPGPVRAWCRIAHPLSLAGPNDPRQVNIAGFFLSSVESPCFRGFILKYSRAALSHAALRIP
ncbi:hypothetical protein QMTAC487_20610 [Sphaerotilus sp. FB-3]|nr:hypothetical protein QMTAC487_20610 [Sphaerotilus sp. FB-3]